MADRSETPVEPVRVVLEGVPRVSFEKDDDKVELCPFPSCLKACLTFMGEEYPYEYVMCTSGAAFRLLWKPGWWIDNVDIRFMAEDPLEPFRRAFEAVGYAHDIFGRWGWDEGCDDETYFRGRIIESICDKKRPVIGFGVIGPPESCVITGYDESGDILIGWSYFQGFEPGVELESSGYFRKQGWFKDTEGLIIIGEKIEKPPLGEIYRRVLKWALEVARTPMVNVARTLSIHGGVRHSGLAAYTAWAEALLRDEDFPLDDIAVLHNRFMSHSDNTMVVAEGRWNASRFLKQMAEHEPVMAEELLAAAACYAAEHSLMWQGWNLVGGIGWSESHARKLAEPDIRHQISSLILKARDKEAEAANHIEQALAK